MQTKNLDPRIVLILSKQQGPVGFALMLTTAEVNERLGWNVEPKNSHGAERVETGRILVAAAQHYIENPTDREDYRFVIENDGVVRKLQSTENVDGERSISRMVLVQSTKPINRLTRAAYETATGGEISQNVEMKFSPVKKINFVGAKIAIPQKLDQDGEVRELNLYVEVAKRFEATTDGKYSFNDEQSTITTGQQTAMTRTTERRAE